MKVLVTGATGYVGSRLTATLLDQGHQVRCMVRSPEKLILPPGYKPEIAIADVRDADGVAAALQGIDVAYYLIHSLHASRESFEKIERESATTFAKQAGNEGIKRIIYLGGLGAAGDDLSPHLKSRQETGGLLGSAGVPVTEFRAGSVVGSGSLAFEILRYLTERIPVMIAPRWLHSLTHPIAIADVLYYLSESLVKPETAGKTFEIGCPENMTYKEMMKRYARVRGLKRLIITVPFLTPYISSLWVNLVTPLPRNVAMALFESIRNDITADTSAVEQFFDHETIPFEEAARRALDKSQSWIFESERIPNLLERKVLNKGKRELIHSRGFIIEKRLEQSCLKPERLFEVLNDLGGKNGWPYANALWSLRMLLDKMVGGKSKRFRQTPGKLVEGEKLDFWTIQKHVPGKKLLLRNTDMKIPGKAWLEFSTRDEDQQGCRLTMTAYYEPRGLLGVLYWWLLYPLHALIFSNTLKRIIRRAES